MKHLFSPWRSQYIHSLADNKKSHPNDCFICDAVNLENQEKELLIVARRSLCIVIMNKYPYNSGHVLVCPKRHISNYFDFTAHELTEIIQTTQDITNVMDEIMKPHGYNIGINIGHAAGAGLPQHLHYHIVPRWNGDCNFISTLADIKIISEAIEETRFKLSEALK